MKNLKWFTLVELLVVLTIISILATIWFISYTWYLAWARDTQRISDLDTLNNTIKMYSLNWYNLLSLVNTGSTNRTWSWEFYSEWRNISLNSSYKAWFINFDYLKLINQEIVDPKTKTSYILWVYKTNYELASTMEENKNSYILRWYKTRTSSWTIATLTGVNLTDKYVTLTNIEDNQKFKIGDYIWTWSTSYREIMDIVWSKIYLNDASWISTSNTIKLLNNDTSLIWNSANWSWIWTNCLALDNVAANVCPIKERDPLLLPYKIN
jgi:prepilin-type N-terminal cleavage/methylation domain-containing protein